MNKLVKSQQAEIDRLYKFIEKFLPGTNDMVTCRIFSCESNIMEFMKQTTILSFAFAASIFEAKVLNDVFVVSSDLWCFDCNFLDIMITVSKL